MQYEVVSNTVEYTFGRRRGVALHRVAPVPCSLLGKGQGRGYGYNRKCCSV